MPSSIPDVNVLAALALSDDRKRERARRWLRDVDEFVTTPVTESGVVRIVANPQASGRLTSVVDAFTWLNALKAHPKARFLADDATMGEPMLDPALIRGYRQVTDFHLLDLALKHDAVLVTFDKGIEAAFGHVAGHAIRVL